MKTKLPSKFIGRRILNDDGYVRSWSSAVYYNANQIGTERWALTAQAEEFFHTESGKRGDEIKGYRLSLLPYSEDEASAVLHWLHGDLKKIFDEYGSLDHKVKNRDYVVKSYVSKIAQNAENKFAESFLDRMFHHPEGSVQLLPDGTISDAIKNASTHLGKDLVKYTTVTAGDLPYLDYYNLTEVISSLPGKKKDIPVEPVQVMYRGKPYKVVYELMTPKKTVLEYEGREDWLSEVPLKNIGNFEDCARISAVFVEDDLGKQRVLFNNKKQKLFFKD